MKRTISLITALCLLLALTACGSSTADHSASSAPQPQGTLSSAPQPQGTLSSAQPAEADAPAEAPAESTSTLVVYFSATGNTKAVAEKIAELTGADLYEIVPAEPYSDADLNYNNDDCRANQEMNDESARPAIGSEAIDVTSYETVFVGYPIWWGTMPRILNTFLDTYDLSGKTVLPFCTSGGSGISESVSDIKTAEPDADVRDGLRASGADDSGIEAWIADNGGGQ